MTNDRDYRHTQCQRLTQVNPAALIALMNDADVRRHLPLAKGYFGATECERFVAAKEQIWEHYGYGPWAFMLNGDLVGWGGLQPEGDDVDVGLVLHRDHWGAAHVLYPRILDYAFETLDLPSVIALLPPSRKRVAALHRLGFQRDGHTVIDGEPFNRYRLLRSAGR